MGIYCEVGKAGVCVIVLNEKDCAMLGGKKVEPYTEDPVKEAD